MKKEQVVSITDSGHKNYQDHQSIIACVTQSLEDLQLDEDFFDSASKVVLKPNWVKEHDERTPGPNAWEHVVTHPSVIEGVASFVAARLKKEGKIVICDAPQTDSSFATLRDYCQLDQMISRLSHRFPKIGFELLDLRPVEWNAIDGVTVSKTELEGDPAGDTHVSLNEGSEFIDYQGEGKLFGASYNMEETNLRHQGNNHEYLLCRTPMDADIFINIPKLKTHKKVGLTCALKNLVGINANKNWLPHHTEGTPDAGGDQFPKNTSKAKLEHSWMGKIKKFLTNNPNYSRIFVPLKKLGRLYFGDTGKIVRSGNWYGNDTCWRMVLDLNKCLFFYDGHGQKRKKPPKYLAVVDGILGGDGNGPMAPDPVHSGIIISGEHPLAVDMCSAKMMSFDYSKIRLLQNAFKMKKLSFVDFEPDEIIVKSNRKEWNGPLNKIRSPHAFTPHFGWVGAIEEKRPD